MNYVNFVNSTLSVQIFVHIVLQVKTFSTSSVECVSYECQFITQLYGLSNARKRHRVELP